MRTVFLFLIIVFIFSAFTKEVKRDKVETFKWLVGSWKMPAKDGGSIFERWSYINDTILWGQSDHYSSKGEKRILENLKLVDDGGTYFYVSKVPDQNNDQSVWFKITSHSEKGFVAEKPDHDFPKRITYKLITKDSIHAFIDGGPSMPDKRSDFYYSRYKN